MKDDIRTKVEIYTAAVLWLTLGGWALASAGCSDTATGPRDDDAQELPHAIPGWVRVETTTRGAAEWRDADGYALSVDGVPTVTLGPDDSRRIRVEVAGEHTLTLSMLDLTCTVVGPNPRTVWVPANQERLARIEVECVEPSPPLSGRIVFSSLDAWDYGSPLLYVAAADGSERKPLGRSMTGSLPAVSPDGRWVLFTSQGHSGVGADLFVTSSEGTGLKNLTNSPAFDDRGRWSPDGSRILFTREFDLYVMDADGSDVERVFGSPSNENAAVWSPDGSKIAFTSNMTGEFEIFVMSADGADLVNLTNDPERSDYAPAWSPDGTRIAYASNSAEGEGDIFVMDADGSNRVNVTNHPAHDFWPSWSPTGRYIVFGTGRTGDMEVFVMNADGSGVANVSNRPSTHDYPGFPQAWSPF